MNNLTIREERFAQLLVEYSGDYGRAYAECVPVHITMPADIDTAGRRLANKPHVFCRVQELMAQKSQEYNVTRERLVRELLPIATSKVTDYYSFGPSGVTLKDSDDLTLEQAGCIESVTQTITPSGGSIKVKLHSKMEAIQQLAKLFGLYPDRGSVTVNQTFVLRAPPVAADSAQWLKDVTPAKLIDHDDDA